MYKTMCKDGKRKTQLSFKCNFKASEINSVFSQGFALVFPILKNEQLIHKFQEAEKVAKEALDEVGKILPSPDEIYEITMYMCKATRSVRFDLKFQALFIHVPIEFGNERTKGICIDVAKVIKSMREAEELPMPGVEDIIIHHSDNPPGKSLDDIIPEDSIT